MSDAGYEFVVVEPDVDESAFATDGITACEYAETLALAKAKSVAPGYPDALVIGADTVADFAGEIIGKPNDAEDAERITSKLFSAPHKVITGLAMVRLRDQTEIVRSDSTTVYPKPMTAGQIAEHIQSGTWRDKAGAYAIQETGDEFVERIEGSLTNVMGLPMELLESLLAGMVDDQT
jgi:septum formation protein